MWPQVPPGVQQWVREQLGPRYELLKQRRARRAAASALQCALASGAACPTQRISWMHDGVWSLSEDMHTNPRLTRGHAD